MTVWTVLVTGGAGYIGSHSILELLTAGYDVVALDNFSNSVPTKDGLGAESLRRVEELTGRKLKQFYRCDVTNLDDLRHIFQQHNFDCVIHFASLKAVGESIEKPLKYYNNNLTGALTLLKACQEAGVKKFIFSSSATVYGTPQKLPLAEDHPTGIGITNPYGQTKYFIERILMDFSLANPDWDIVLLRYFNPVGAHSSGQIGEDPKDIPNNLMPYVAQVAIGKLPHVRVFGNDYDTPDGTGVRDYIHIVDLAKGHVAAADLLKKERVKCKVYNLGTGCGYSVLEMIAAMENACGHKVDYSVVGRRNGDIATVYCDPSLAAVELNWKAELGLTEMCRDIWNWQKKNPNGFMDD